MAALLRSMNSSMPLHTRWKTLTISPVLSSRNDPSRYGGAPPPPAARGGRGRRGRAGVARSTPSLEAVASVDGTDVGVDVGIDVGAISATPPHPPTNTA